MATTEPISNPQSVIVGSSDTALCIIPPSEHWPSLDRLRMLYDKAYEKWPPHVNLVYPFVQSESLSKAAGLILSHLKEVAEDGKGSTVSISLNSADFFPHRRDNTIFIHDTDVNRTTALDRLRTTILESLGQHEGSYRMHMTIGQSDDLNSDPHKFLLGKAGLIPPLSWTVEELCILVREKTPDHDQLSSQMKIWGTLSLKDYTIRQLPTPLGLYNTTSALTPVVSESKAEAPTRTVSSKRHSYKYSVGGKRWKQNCPNAARAGPQSPETLKIASYNVLAEFHHPPSQERYPLIVNNLLDPSAISDILVLEEVTDDFLGHLLADERVREEYPFVSCGPPSQSDIEPLPSHLNIVALSKWSFTWDWLTFKSRHKGSAVLRMDHIGTNHGVTFKPLIVATVHLTCGLTDSSVAAKKTELQSILKFLSGNYPDSPWVVAGDFNITSSTFTVNAALEKKAIAPQTAKYLADLEILLSDYGLADAWIAARLQNVDSTHFDDAQLPSRDDFEGEQGATFDPTCNQLAAAVVGNGHGNRPQRYDRILFRAVDFLAVDGFNMFGRQVHDVGSFESSPSRRLSTYASDHWGVRCSLKLTCSAETTSLEKETSKLLVPVVMKSAPTNLADANELKICLAKQNVFPTDDDLAKRVEAISLLQATLSDTERSLTSTSQSRSNIQFVVVPVGSYGLGVWTAASDVDCLCLGPISPKTFFALATQRLRKASAKGVKVLRRVIAFSGTMLELEVLGVKMDLQYCPSASIAQTWPKAVELPASDPMFMLSAQTLAKLKPARDLHYLRRTVPDLAAFKTAFYLIKTWAKRHGIYAARFGYLGGIHIATLLSRICKLLSSETGPSPSVPTIILTFFSHYANFDWKTQIVFDPFFHKKLRYIRTSREPMVILGFHSPSLNVATAASGPTVRTISEELQKADRILSREGARWEDLIGSVQSPSSNGPSSFLRAYKSYVKIDVQFWGISLAKGSQFVGWLESRCVMLLVDIARRLPQIHARMWPARFVDRASSDSSETDYQGCYLIGLDKLESSDGDALSKADMKTAYGSLLTAAQKFEGQIKGDEKYFDSKSSWMSASIIKQSELGDLKLDHREWGEYTIGEDEDEEDEEEEEDSVLENDETDAHAATAKRSKKVDKPLPVQPTYEGKFRTSADVINRIRWDPGMDSTDYLVGYEDRFLGIMERPLDQWKAEQTDEEFIPQHRIMYFKRVSDARLVWDRKSRRDEVFGTGVQVVNVRETAR